MKKIISAFFSLVGNGFLRTPFLLKYDLKNTLNNIIKLQKKSSPCKKYLHFTNCKIMPIFCAFHWNSKLKDCMWWAKNCFQIMAPFSILQITNHLFVNPSQVFSIGINHVKKPPPRTTYHMQSRFFVKTKLKIEVLLPIIPLLRVVGF